MDPFYRGRTRSTVTQLTNVCETKEGIFVLDLSKLKFVDDTGADLIRMLSEKGAKLRGASALIKLLIDGNSEHK